MRHTRLAFGLLAAAVVAAAVTNIALSAQETIDRATIDRIRAEGTTRSKVLETYGYITNVTGARPTGSKAHKQAADYMRAKLAEWGMANSHLEPFMFGRGWDLEKFTLELTGPRYFPMYGYPQAWMPSTKGVLQGPAVYLGDKTAAEIEAMGEKLRGAIVLLSPPQTVFTTRDRQQPADFDRPVNIGGPEPLPAAERQVQASPASGGAANAILLRFGAGALLRPSSYPDLVVGASGSQNTAKDVVPIINVVAEHYNMVVRMHLAGVAPQLRLELRTAYLETDLNSYNVIAEIPGEDPVLRNEIVLIGAHLDSLPAGSGATDNADGAASVAEAMRILKAVGVRPRRTIRVAIWSGEEVGFVGGNAYVNALDQAARDRISVYLNNDPGAGASYGWYLANNEVARPIMDSWLNQMKDLGLKKNVMESNFTSEDGVFDRAGIPAFTTIQDYTKYDAVTRHTNADFFEAVSEKDLQQASIMMAAFAYQAAMRNERIPRRPAGVSASTAAQQAGRGRGAQPAPGTPDGRGGAQPGGRGGAQPGGRGGAQPAPGGRGAVPPPGN